jgi:murein DD-endopeptidase MepM/ murein hydrolase activator NlpD
MPRVPLPGAVARPTWESSTPDASVIARARPGRTRSLLTLLALVGLLAVPATAPPLAAGASLSDQIEAARERQAELGRSIARQETILRALDRDQASTQAAIADTEAQLDRIDVDQAAVARRIEQAIARLARVRARLAELVDELRQSDWTLDLLSQELASGEEDLRARRAALGQRLSEAYRAESTTLLEQVFTADSFTDVMSQANAYLAYGDRDRQLAQDIAADQQALDALRLVTTSTRLRTDQLRRATIEAREQVEARKAELKAAQRRLAALERRTERIKAAQQARYRELVANEREAKEIQRKMVAAKLALQARIAGLVRAAQRAAAARSGGAAPRDGGGFFRWPAAGTISGNYGCSSFAMYPPGGGCAHFHDGIDIANNVGTSIVAAADGVVAFAGYRADGALVIVMGHKGGFETTYAHLSSVSVRARQFVRRGQRIGAMGCSGFCTGPHLHWEVSKGFRTLNPRAYLSPPRARAASSTRSAARHTEACSIAT